jgi:hypothetical protein
MLSLNSLVKVISSWSCDITTHTIAIHSELGKLYALHSKLECVAFRIGWLKDADKGIPNNSMLQ